MQYIKLNLKKLSFVLPLAFLIPSVAFAKVDDLKSLISELNGMINSVIPFLFGLAVVGLMWGIIKYINAGDPKKIGEARNYIIFSIIALAVMLSVWSLALLLKNTFFGGTPSFPSSRNGTLCPDPSDPVC